MSAAMLPTDETPARLDELLREQGDLTAVARFAQWHDEASVEPHAPHYRQLLPLTAPQPGEQYAFEVDLDACSGCQACVTACHNLNGLDEHETWRSVGLLQGVEAGLPVLHHVTTACHHCLEPACLAGCPTQAYEKDTATGIVRHLDDQCFGCQYCILMCPYEVPTYSPQRGIVRKCDMCRQRLAENELPACVQGCPNGAIAIRLVSHVDVAARSAVDAFLPTAPSPALTRPSTHFLSAKALPDDTLAGDHEHFSPAHAHWPLVFMLVLTQMSLGVLAIAHTLVYWLEWLPPAPSRAVLNAIAAAVGVVGANLALLHLGRPLQAHRAWLGWRTSWLSREVIAFGAYVPLALAAAGAAWLPGEWNASWQVGMVELVAIAAGIAAVYCSAMIYVATRRGYWSGPRTFRRFGLTAFMLGNAVCTAYAAALAAQQEAETAWDYRFPLATMSIAALVAIWRWQGDRRWLAAASSSTEITVRGPARLLTETLRPLLQAQRGAALLAAFVLPLLVVLLLSFDPVSTRHAVTILCLARVGLVLLSEVVERYLFFTASVSPRMPGALLR